MAMPHILLRNGEQMYVDNTNEELWMQVGNTYTLEHVGFGPLAGKAAPTVTSDNPAIVVTIISTTDNKQTITVTARGAGKAVLRGRSAAGPAADLTIFAGSFQNHFGSGSIDLVADVLRRADPVRVHLVQEILYNLPDNIFEQNNAKNKHPVHKNMACGIVAKERGNQLFSKDPLDVVPQLGSPSNVPDVVCPIHYELPYHEPLQGPPTKRSDVKYTANKIRDVRLKILGFLKAGTPVRVGVADSPVGMRLRKSNDPARKGYDLYAYDPGGHTVLIYGCNDAANQFLYLDPWGGGSTLKYEGGIETSTRPTWCWYMGIFRSMYDAGRLLTGGTPGFENVLRQTLDTEGTFNSSAGNYLEIISGP
jgi:hypothetical protein